MEEIASFAREDQAAHDTWMAISAFYDRLAADVAGDHKEADTSPASSQRRSSLKTTKARRNVVR